MDTFLGLIILFTPFLLFGWLAGAMADSRHRPVAGWFILGCVFTILTVIILALIGKARMPS